MLRHFALGVQCVEIVLNDFLAMPLGVRLHPNIVAVRIDQGDSERNVPVWEQDIVGKVVRGRYRIRGAGRLRVALPPLFVIAILLAHLPSVPANTSC